MNERPLRILRVITRLNVGGPALHIVTLTANTDPSRFDSLLAVGEPDTNEGDMLDLRPDLRKAIGNRVYRVRRLRRPPAPLSDASVLRDLRLLIRRFNPQILETHMAKAGTLGRIAAFLERVPIVVHTFHGTSFEGHFPAAVGRLMAGWERVLARKTDLVIAVSPAVRRDLEARGIGRGRIRVIPLGLDLSAFLALPPLHGPAPRVVTLVARLAPVKDVPLFLEAAAIARQSLPDLEALVVGDGPLREVLKADSPPWVSWLGNRADLPDIIAGSGVIALTSRSEGLPVSLIEGLAGGRPVVGLPVGGVVDLLDGRPGAILTPDRSPRALADAMLRALEDDSLRKGAEQGRRQMATDFGLRRLVETMEAVYLELSDRALSGRTDK